MCYDNLTNDNYTVNDEGAPICSKCLVHKPTKRIVHQFALQIKAGEKNDNMKCCRCSVCNEEMSTSSSEGLCRRLENGKWICQKCGTCSQCLKFIKAEDLKEARRQGYKIWHSQCFRCIVRY